MHEAGKTGFENRFYGFQLIYSSPSLWAIENGCLQCFLSLARRRPKRGRNHCTHGTIILDSSKYVADF